MKAEVFLDSSFAIAAVSPRDHYHARAASMTQELEVNATRIVSTYAVFLEIGNSLAKRRTRSNAIRTIEWLQHDPSVEIVPLDPDLFNRAFELFRQRADKEWGLVDCVSFIVMQQRGLTESLTSDQHFEQAGFVALLRH